MLIIFIRAIILMVTLIIVMRLMGKRQIGEMQPYEFIITLLIAELACVPMSDVSVPLIYGIVSVIAVFLLHQIITVIQSLSKPFRHLISGKPSVVIDKDGVNLLELRRNNLGVDDLIESLRNTGNYSLDTVSYAIYESNGQLSVLQNPNAENCGLSVLIVAEGKVDQKNVSLLHLGNDFLTNFMREHNVNSLKQIEVLTIDQNGKVYLKQSEKKFITLNIELPEGCNKW